MDTAAAAAVVPKNLRLEITLFLIFNGFLKEFEEI